MEQTQKMTRLEKRWVLYDVGNSAFTLLISTILPIYFNGLAGAAGADRRRIPGLLGVRGPPFVTVVVAVLGPTLGAVADLPGMKKKLFALCVAVGIAGCAVMGAGAVLGVVFGVLHHRQDRLQHQPGLLRLHAHRRHRPRTDGQGVLGGGTPLATPAAASPLWPAWPSSWWGYQALGISLNAAMLLAFLLNAAWWLCCTLPLLGSYRQRYSVRGGGHLVRGAFRRLGETLREIRGNKQVFWFLIAFFLYIDGVYTIIDMATAYGQALGLDSTGLLLALLVTQIVAFPFALLFGWLARRVDTALLVSVGILAYVGIAAYAIFLRTQGQFWVLAVCVGMFQGGIQSLSRSYFGKIIPPERSGEYYGLLDICGKGASFVGTFLVSALTQLSGSTSTGVMVIAPLILLGFFAFRRAVREGRKNEY